MAAINQDVALVVPETDAWPLLRGVLIGVAVGATVTGLIIVGRLLYTRRAARRRNSPPGGAVSPDDTSDDNAPGT